VSNPENQKQTIGASGGVDYHETPDVTQVHAAIRREHDEPLTQVVPVPLWLMGLFGLAVFWGAFYLGSYNGAFSSDVYNESAGASVQKANGAGGDTASAPAEESPVAQGKKVFLQNCAVCHQPTGLGIPGQYPPLAKSEYANGSPKRLAMILLKGLQGHVKVNGAAYNGAMPAWVATLTDKKIAAVLTYVRQEWGNSAPEISPEQIATARKLFKDRTDPWAEADLLAVPADAQLEGGSPAAATETKK
jgi:mono/diheme cytochrome c family protein